MAAAGTEFDVIEIDVDDDASIERFVTFENRVRTDRARTVAGRRSAHATNYASLFLLAERDGGSVAFLNAFVQDVDGGKHVHLQVGSDTARDGAFAAIELLVETAAAWQPWVERTEALLVNLPDPSDDDVARWVKLGFEPAGSRIGWRRVVQAGERLDVPVVPGVRVVSLPEHPELLESAYEAWRDAYAAVPDDVVSDASPDYAQWLDERLQDNAGVLAPSFLVAVDDADRVVGVGYLVAFGGGSSEAGHRFTGVVGDWRGRGIARLLKASHVNLAASQGITALCCSNHRDNHAMLHINETLGYERTSTIVMLRRPHH